VTRRARDEKGEPPRARRKPSPHRTTRKSTVLPEIRGLLPVPKGIMPWERELLLPIVLKVLTDFVESNVHGKPTEDEKSK
jgi:hypothetical protein